MKKRASDTPNLLTQLRAKKAHIGVIGMGYVGLPLALSLATVGFPVVGLDKNKARIRALKKGVLNFAQREPGLFMLLQKTIKKGTCFFTIDPHDLLLCQVLIVTVQTPLADGYLRPDYSILRSAVRTAIPVLQKGSLIIVQSTIAPGTSREVLIPLIERLTKMKMNKDAFYSYAPERVMPGRMLETIRDLPRVIGANNLIAKKATRLVYQPITAGVIDETSIETAEVVKTAENAHRFVEIAYANALATLCERYGVSFQDVHRLANKRENVHLLQPGIGVGGHCIPKDPWLLVWHHRKDWLARLFRQSYVINQSMASHLLTLIQRGLAQYSINTHDARVAILGYSYREGSDDIRSTPAERILPLLQKLGIRYMIHDPYIPIYQKPLEQIVKGKDAVVIFTAHSEYKKYPLDKLKRLVKHPIIIDGRQTWVAEKARKLGFVYYQIGDVNQGDHNG